MISVLYLMLTRLVSTSKFGFYPIEDPSSSLSIRLLMSYIDLLSPNDVTLFDNCTTLTGTSEEKY